MSFETFTAVMFEVEVFWVVTPCGVVVGSSLIRFLRRDSVPSEP
jgi:hypothetical protein